MKEVVVYGNGEDRVYIRELTLIFKYKMSDQTYLYMAEKVMSQTQLELKLPTLAY